MHYTRDLWRIRGTELAEPEVTAGEKARLMIHLEPFAGPSVVRTVDVTMPLELAGKEVELEIIPGYEVAPEQSAPENLTQLLINEPRQSLDVKSVVVQFRLPSQGVTFNGHVAQDLPDFAISAFRPVGSTMAPEPFNSYSRTTFAMDRYVESRDKVKVKVRAPVK